jgi:hypothetical protein
MTLFASLPMYNLPEMRAVNARFWQALRGPLLEAGLTDVPETLIFERGRVPPCLEPEMLFSQTCGYPLETVFHGQAIRIGTPSTTPSVATARAIALFSWCGQNPRRTALTTCGAAFFCSTALYRIPG